jgi:DNA-binding NarL/FixJ family response regulator
VKILLVDDHAFFRAGVRRLLTATSDFEIVGEAATAADAFEIVERVAPDVVLMDIEMPGMDGILASREILRRAPRARVLILSGHDQLNDVVAAFAAGVSGYALKEDVPAALIVALRDIERGARYVAPALAARLRRFENSRKYAEDLLGVLARREREVFSLAADCVPAREIAVRLCIARKTVDAHLYRIHRKLSLRNMAELVRMGTTLRWIEQADASKKRNG